MLLGPSTFFLNPRSTCPPHFLVRYDLDCRCCVQCFWRNVGTVWPSDGRSVNKKFFKVIFILQGFENRTAKPTFKVDNLFRPVIKFYFNEIVSNVFCFCH